MRWLMALGLAGCGTLTVQVKRGPLPEPDATWHATSVETGSPALLGINAHWNGLSGTVADTRSESVETPYVQGVARFAFARRSGLHVLSLCSLGPSRDDGLGVGSAEPVPADAAVPWAQPQRTAEGGTLRIAGHASSVDSLPWREVPSGVDVLSYELDNRPVARATLAWSLDRWGWRWNGNAWVAADGTERSGAALACRPGAVVTLPLGGEDLEGATAALWLLRARRGSGQGLLRPDAWRAWRDAVPHTLLAEASPGPAIAFTCPVDLGPGDLLALVTTGTHPDYVFVHLLALQPLAP